MSLLTKIQELCEKQGITIAQIEKDLSFGNGSIRRWDTNSPSCNKVLKLANYLNTSVDSLLENTNSNNFSNPLSEQEQLLIEAFREASEQQKMEIIYTVMSAKKNKNKTDYVPDFEIAAFGGGVEKTHKNPKKPEIT